jgi:hypothetical protein
MGTGSGAYVGGLKKTQKTTKAGFEISFIRKFT